MWKVTNDLVIRATGVIRPGRLLHHRARHRLKVHEIVALLEDGLGLDALLPLLLLRVELFLLLLDGAHVHIAQVLRLIEILVQRVRRVDGVVGLGGILAGELENDIRPTCYGQTPIDASDERTYQGAPGGSPSRRRLCRAQ